MSCSFGIIILLMDQFIPHGFHLWCLSHVLLFDALADPLIFLADGLVHSSWLSLVVFVSCFALWCISCSSHVYAIAQPTQEQFVNVFVKNFCSNLSVAYAPCLPFNQRSLGLPSEPCCYLANQWPSEVGEVTIKGSQ